MSRASTIPRNGMESPTKLISLLNRPLWYMVTLRYFDQYDLCYSHGRLRGFTTLGNNRATFNIKKKNCFR